MSALDLLQDLTDVRDAADKAQAALDDATARRQTLVRQCLAAGVPVVQIVEAAGLSRARIYQIRDGRR